MSLRDTLICVEAIFGLSVILSEAKNLQPRTIAICFATLRSAILAQSAKQKLPYSLRLSRSLRPEARAIDAAHQTAMFH